MPIVSYFVPGKAQCNTGDVVKPGSKYIHVRERNTYPRPVIKLSIKDNHVRYLFSDRNPFDRVKGSRKKRTPNGRRG